MRIDLATACQALRFRRTEMIHLKKFTNIGIASKLPRRSVARGEHALQITDRYIQLVSYFI